MCTQHAPTSRVVMMCVFMNISTFKVYDVPMNTSKHRDRVLHGLSSQQPTHTLTLFAASTEKNSFCWLGDKDSPPPFPNQCVFRGSEANRWEMRNRNFNRLSINFHKRLHAGRPLYETPRKVRFTCSILSCLQACRLNITVARPATSFLCTYP